MLAVRVLQEQRFEVDALNVSTPFECCQARAAQAAKELGIPLTALRVDDDYLEVLRKPAHGYGKAVNPCIDCRIYMMKMARCLMEQREASIVISGEILGQRPMSQKRRDLMLIARDSGLEDRLLRPLCARLLPPTLSEREGLVDRTKLYGFSGRGRRQLARLAQQLGVRRKSGPSTGCSLTEPSFAPRVYDLMQHVPQATRWEFEVLSAGRHIRLDKRTKVVLGRNKEDNETIRGFAKQKDGAAAALLEPIDFPGPTALVIGSADEETLRYVGAMILQYSRRTDPSGTVALRVVCGNRTSQMAAYYDEAVRFAVPL
jgi:hypothetical protein